MFILPERFQNYDIQFIKGVGPHYKKLLNKKGLHDITDLLTFFPRDYQDRRRIVKIAQLNEGFFTIKAKVVDIFTIKMRNLPRVEIIVEDETGRIVLIFYNQNYLANVFKVGDEIVVSGNVDFGYGRLYFNNPEWEKEGESDVNLNYGRIVPVYPLTEGLSQNKMRGFIYNALTMLKDDIMDPLPDSIVEKFGLINEKFALIRTHFPKNEEDFQIVSSFNSDYQKRMIFDDVFYLQYFWNIKKQKIKSLDGIKFKLYKKELTDFINGLEFELTNSQKKALEEILQDLSGGKPMNRLLQGDVGSGKTVVSLISMVNAYHNGYQSAIMAPTEVLAQQHYIKIKEFLKHLDIKCAILYGAMKASEKKEMLDSIKSGQVQIIIGTHALFQEGVEFNDLGYVIIDEQHRFGVEQRMDLIAKGKRPHILTMSATPIPRSIAMTIYGDMDFTVIDEMPKGRSPVRTEIVRKEARLYEEIAETVRKGEKAFVVYPLIEETENLDLQSAVSGYEKMCSVFAKEKVGLLHGKMKSKEKIEVMGDFSKGGIDILVSTTVIEVGIDVPLATLMIVINAERFGLSQLHQLRGRVGRSDLPSKCLLFTENRINQRLSVMAENNDGFHIALEDMKIRGPGDILGTFQSGMPSFKMFNYIRDRDLVQLCEKIIDRIKVEYGDLDHPELANINTIVQDMYLKRMKFSEVL